MVAMVDLLAVLVERAERVERAVLAERVEPGEPVDLLAERVVLAEAAVAVVALLKLLHQHVLPDLNVIRTRAAACLSLRKSSCRMITVTVRRATRRVVQMIFATAALIRGLSAKERRRHLRLLRHLQMS